MAGHGMACQGADRPGKATAGQGPEWADRNMSEELQRRILGALSLLRQGRNEEAIEALEDAISADIPPTRCPFCGSRRWLEGKWKETDRLRRGCLSCNRWWGVFGVVK
jgi:hypothetical protein